MTSHENTTSAIEESLNASQVLFTANPLFLTPQSKHIFQAQERIWDEIEHFSNAWFQRRQDATQAIINAGRRMASEGRNDPSSMMKEMSELQASALQRLTADARECAEMLNRCADSLVQKEAQAIEETSETTQKLLQTAKSEPV